MKTRFTARILASASLSAISMAALTLVGGTARAQSLDYGTLQEMFGEPVTTSATGKPQRASEVPANLTIITAEEIRRTGLSTIPDVLARLSGMDFLRHGAANADLSVRGYNQPASPRLLVLVNGRQVYADHYAYTIWSSIPVQLSEIRQIEVVKGPNAALFGFNAVSGVINIVTWNPLHDDVSSASVRAGTGDLREASVVRVGRIGEGLGYRLSAGIRSEDEFEGGIVRPAEGGITAQDPLSKSLAGALVMEVTPDIQAQVEATHSFTRLAEMFPINAYNANSTRTTSVKADVTASTDAGLLSVSAYRNWLEIDFRNGPVDAGGEPVDVETTVVQVADLFKIGTDHAVRLSGEYRRNEMDVFPDRGSTIGYDVYAVGAMWDWQISDSLSLTNALRADRFVLDLSGPPAFPRTAAAYDRAEWEFSYNGGMVWKMSDQDTLRLTAARGVQTPSLVEMSYTDTLGANPALNASLGLPAGFRIPAVGDPQLESSTVTNVEAGWDHTMPITGGSLTLSSAVYWQRTTDIKSPIPFPPALQVAQVAGAGAVPYLSFRNVGDSEAIGAELDLEARFDNGLTATFSYAVIDVDDDFPAAGLRVPGANTLAYPVRYEGAAAENRVTAGLGYVHDGWTADLFIAWSEGRTLLRDLTGSYTAGQVPLVLDDTWLSTASLGRELMPGITLQATVQGLFGDEQLGSGLETERRAFLTLTAAF
ncbi:MAG: hypothetical protein RLY86_1009 [Pseudomonadota bacterium]|jgi:iron complex outermembrane receptor protein